MTKIRTICVDTLTAIQVNDLMREKRKATLDKWRDYGQDIFTFMDDLQKLGFELIMILGEPGTGKSSGMASLPAGTNIWFNADNKNPVWEGGKEIYGKKNNPKMPYHMVPESYADIIAHIKEGLANNMFEEERYAIITGHTETYKVGMETRERLKTIGQIATKMQLEGKLETVLYSAVDMDGEKPRYVLVTQNNGSNTARSPQGLFEGRIDNDYNFVVNKLLSY